MTATIQIASTKRIRVKQHKRPAKTREEWLHRLIDYARPMFAALGSPIPDNVRAAICPPKGKGKAIGVCWHSVVSADKGREVWISSEVVDTMQIAATLVHELAHAALPDDVKHGYPFQKLARALHLEGKFTATYGGADFAAVWAPLLEAAGPYPGVASQRHLQPKKPSYNNVKFECAACEGLFYVAITRAPDVQSCPFCGSDAHVHRH